MRRVCKDTGQVRNRTGSTRGMQRVCATVLSVLMVTVLLPGVAQAVSPANAFTVTGAAGGYTYENYVLTFTSPGTYAVSMADGASSATTDRIVVNAPTSSTATPVNITLNGVSIDLSAAGGCALDIQGNSTVNLTLADSTQNTLKSGESYAGLDVSGSSSALTIDGPGSLTAVGGGDGGSGAGIGGGASGNSGAITISGGMITATGGAGSAGIGGGDWGDCGAVTISSGTIIAQGGGDYSAGIGGGIGGDGGSEGTLTNGATPALPVYLTQVTLEDVTVQIAVKALTTDAGPMNDVTDVVTDDSGTLYLYLPEGAVVTAATTAAGDFYYGRVETNDQGTASGMLPLVGDIIRYAGDDRYETAALVSEATYPEGSDTVIIVSGENYPDALAASALAGVSDAPILFTRQDSLPEATATELKRLLPTYIYIVGGSGVISDEVSDEIFDVVEAAYPPRDPDVDYPAVVVPNVQRIGGVDRYETATLVAESIMNLWGDTEDDVLLATGANYIDALSASSLAANQGIPVLFTQSDTLNTFTQDFIEEYAIDDVTIVGGTGVVSEDVENALKAEDIAVDRFGGLDRYETATIFVTGSIEKWSLEPERFGVVSATNYPDALVGGASIGNRDGIVLITNPTTLTDSADAVLTDFRPYPHRVEIFGGTGAVSQDVEGSIAGIITIITLDTP